MNKACLFPLFFLLLAILPYLMSLVPNVYYKLAVPPYDEITSGSVLVTGASRGIGKDIALYLDSQGFKVYAGVRNEKAGAELKKVSNTVIPIVLDINNDEHIEKAVKTISSDSTKFVAIVNNAAVLHSGPFEALSPNVIRQGFNTNLVNTVVITNQFLPLLRKNKGRIVMISSLVEEIPMPFLGVYPATKTGLYGFCESLRRELSPYGVHVADVQPGVVLTDMMAIGSSPDYWKENVDAQRLPELEKVYAPYYTKENQEYMRETMYAAPMEAIDVAKAVHHAISSSAPKAEYLLSDHAPILQLLRNLPTWFQDWYTHMLLWPGPYATVPKK